MAEIEVEGLGIVTIEGDTPTPVEEQVILRALEDAQASDRLAPSRVRAGLEEPTFRQAEDESLRALEADQPQIDEMLRARGGIEDVTGGFVNRPALTMAGGTAGGAVGAAGGAVLGAPGGPPGIAAGGSLGLVGGSALGSAAGSLMFDTLDEATRFFKDTQRGGDRFDPTFRALEEARQDFLFTAGAGALGPVIRRLKPLVGKALGVGSKKLVADLAEVQQIPIGVIQATKSKAVKGVSRVLGVFPFVGKPFRDASDAAAKGAETRFNDILNTLAPNATIGDLGIDLTGAARLRFGKFRRVAGALYARFDNLAAAADVPDFIPTETVRRLTSEFGTAAREGQIALRGGKQLKTPIGDDVQDFLDQLTKLPERITVKQARQLQRNLQDLIGRTSKDGRNIGRLIEVKKALEVDLNNPLTDLLPKEQADEILGALNKANEFYGSTIQRFQTPTAKRFGRVDRNIFRSGAFKAGTINEDEVFNAVFNMRSPQALDDLKALVGPEAFRKSGRAFLERSFGLASKGSAKGGVALDVEDFAKRIGLTSETGREALRRALKGSLVTVKDMESFVEVARAADSFVVPDASVFLQRRLTLAGLQNIAGGFALGAGVIADPVSVAAAVLMARQSAKILTSPAQLKLMTRVLDDTLPNQQRRAMLFRLGQLTLGEPSKAGGSTPISGTGTAGGTSEPAAATTPLPSNQAAVPGNTVETSNEDPFEFIKRGAEEVNERLREEVRRRVRAGESVRFDPRSGIQPLTELDKLRRGAEPTLRRGPEFQSSRERLGPLGRSNFGGIGIGDFVPGVDVGLAVDDLKDVRARERAGLDVGTGEKVGAVMGVPLAVLGFKQLSKAGGELFDRVARRLGKKPTTSVIEKLAKEGIPISENIASGKEAVEKVLSEKTSIPAAMYRPDVGEITFDFGRPGDPKTDFKKRGEGLAHIIARRNVENQDGERFVREELPEVLAKGRLAKMVGVPNNRRALIEFRGNRVVLSLFRFKNRESWVITGYEIFEKEK